jgi:hypothetical protein
MYMVPFNFLIFKLTGVVGIQGSPYCYRTEWAKEKMIEQIPISAQELH